MRFNSSSVRFATRSDLCQGLCSKVLGWLFSDFFSNCFLIPKVDYNRHTCKPFKTHSNVTKLVSTNLKVIN